MEDSTKEIVKKAANAVGSLKVKKNKDDNIHKSEALKSNGRTNEH